MLRLTTGWVPKTCAPCWKTTSDDAPRLSAWGCDSQAIVTDEELNAVIDRVVGGNQETRDLINVVDRFDQLPAELQDFVRDKDPMDLYRCDKP